MNINVLLATTDYATYGTEQLSPTFSMPQEDKSRMDGEERPAGSTKKTINIPVCIRHAEVQDRKVRA